MSSEAKRVKILTLIQLGFGLILFGYAISLLVRGIDAIVCSALAADGVITFFLGVRGALIANVPARIAKLATLALIFCVLQIACTVVVVCSVGVDNVGDNLLPVAASAVPALTSFVIWLLSHGMAKRAER